MEESRTQKKVRDTGVTELTSRVLQETRRDLLEDQKKGRRVKKSAGGNQCRQSKSDHYIATEGGLT